MSVLDTSAIVDLLLGDGAAPAVELVVAKRPCAAPDVVVFETLAVLRRALARGAISERRANAAVIDLGDLSVELFPTLALRERAWELRKNMTAADALFVALAEALDEPLVTKDSGMAAAATRHTDIEVIELG